jgi:hypothetical protein
MTLEEQIRPHTKYWDCYNDEPELYNHTGKVLKIADEFAIGFAEWCVKSEGKDYNKYKYRDRKELLEIYKKENEL